MKKEYVTPIMATSLVQVEGLIAASPTGTNVDGLGVSGEKYEDDSRAKSGNGFNVWSDDWSK